jgi:hypothetical protein
VSGDEIFFLSKMTKTRRRAAGGGRETVRHPFLHKVVANTINMVALKAREAVIDRIGDTYTIREKRSKGRTPSFLQNQVKIRNGKYARPEDFPRCEVVLEIQPYSKESNRRGIPLIADILESGGIRTPFVGKKWEMPITANVRVGGVKEGKVRTKHRFDRMDTQTVHYTPKEHRKVKRGPGIIRAVNDSTNQSYIIQTLKSGRSKVLYYGDPTPKRMQKSLRFYDTVKSAVASFAQKYLDALVARMGYEKHLMSGIKYINKM